MSAKDFDRYLIQLADRTCAQLEGRKRELRDLHSQLDDEAAFQLCAEAFSESAWKIGRNIH